ncbi:LysR substrate-binding domain-containing protein [Phenylobacterium zucineum]|nr:LysR substrate-binding domain-containing protein [Phenylobacterium zucineum]
MPREKQRAGTSSLRTLGARAMPPFAALRAFEAVGALGGIRRAAQELGVDHAAVSRHIRFLEDWAGVPLIDRPQGGRLTPEGQRFHQRIAAALEEIVSASAELTRRGHERRLLVWCVPGFAYRWLNARLADFSASHPDFDLEIRPTDHAPDLARHEADADIRYVHDYDPPQPADVETMEIARPPVIPVGSPDLVASLGPPVSPQRFLDGPLLHEEGDGEWRAWLAGNGVEVPDRLPGPRLWHAHLTIDAARRGQGIALTNPFLAGEDLAAGNLRIVPLVEGAADVRLGAYVFRTRRDRWRTPAVIAFRRWLEREAAKTPA